MLSLSDLTTERTIFEARFPPNFLFWDYSGEIWTRVGHHFPTIKLVVAQPSNTQFETDEFFFTCSPDSLRITCKETTAFQSFKETATIFFNTCTEILRVDRVERLGLRIIFAKEYKSIAEAAEVAFAFGRLQRPHENFFKTAGKPNLVDWRVSWQGPEVGVLLMVRSEERNINAQFPWELRGKASVSVKNTSALVVDADYFTTIPLHRDQVSVDEWLRSSDRAIRKGIEREVLNG